MVVLAREEGEEKNKRVNVSYLDSESHEGEKKVIIPERLESMILPSLIEIEQNKEDMAEEKADTRRDNIK